MYNMPSINEIIENLKGHFRGIAGDSVEILKKSNDKIVKKLDELDAKKEDRVEEHKKDKKTSQEAILSQIKGVENAVKAHKEVESVSINNPEAITGDLKEGLQGIISTLQKELKNFDKNIVVKNDFSNFASLFKSSQDKTAVINALKKIEDKLDRPDKYEKEDIDYTMILSDIAKAVEDKEAITILKGILEKELNVEIPSIMDVNLNPLLVEDDRIRTVLPDDQVEKMAKVLTGGDNKHVILQNPSGRDIDVQYPLPTDGDSVYCKDIDPDNSDIGNFSGSVCDLVDSLKTLITDTTSNNPKTIKIWFYRTIYAHEIGLGCDDLAQGFGTDVTVKFLGSGEEVRATKNFTGINKNSALLKFEPLAFNGIILEFNTADTVCISNLTIRKAIETTSFIKVQKPDGTIVTAQGTAIGNFKTSIEEGDNQASPVHMYITDDTLGTKANVELITAETDNLDGKYGLVTASQNYLRMDGDIVRPAHGDALTHATVMTDVSHYKIHDGDHYNYCDYVLNQALNDTIEFVMTTPDTTQWTHLTFQVFSSTGATIELYEGTTGVTGGTTITPRNNNRNSLNTSVNTLIKDPASITNDGTMAAGYLAGANRSAGFVVRDNENVLKQDTAYLVRITSLAASNNISWCAEWYEHLNKN